MALNSVLDIVTRACDELGLARPGTAGVSGSSLPQDITMVSLLNAAGIDLVAAHDWAVLIATASITTAAATATYTLPTDFDRVVDSTGWDTTNHFPMNGSISPQRQQFWLASSVVAPTTRKEYRLTLTNAGGSVYVNPTPTSVTVLKFLYVSENWKTDSAGNNASDYTSADTDLIKFNPKLMVKELKWRFRAAKGLDATGLRMECDELRSLLISRDIGSGAIDTAGPIEVAPIDYLNVADGNWNLI